MNSSNYLEIQKIGMHIMTRWKVVFIDGFFKKKSFQMGQIVIFINSFQ